jgi:hypothetical protein
LIHSVGGKCGSIEIDLIIQIYLSTSRICLPFSKQQQQQQQQQLEVLKAILESSHSTRPIFEKDNTEFSEQFF